MSEPIYKQAETEVLNRYASQKDSHERSQAWKIKAIEEDRKLNNDSRLLNTFVQEIEEAVDRMEKVKPLVQICKEACQPATKSVDPAMPHGVDLGWD